MSEQLTPLQDTNFNAEINFISLDPDTGDSTFLPIDLASVTYFEINDNLIDFGLTGSVTFPNWGQLLSKLPGVTGSATDLGKGKETHTGTTENFLTIKVNDIDIDETGFEFNDNGYKFLASTKASASLISNAINIKQTVDFEEDMTAILKKISWDVFTESDLAYRVSEGRKRAAGENIPNLTTLERLSFDFFSQPFFNLFTGKMDKWNTADEEDAQINKTNKEWNEQSARQNKKGGQTNTTLAKVILGLLNAIEPRSARMEEAAAEADKNSMIFGSEGDFNIFDEYSPFQGPSSKSLYSIIQSAINHLFFNKNFSSYYRQKGGGVNSAPSSSGVFDRDVNANEQNKRRFHRSSRGRPADLGFQSGATLPLLKTEAVPLTYNTAEEAEYFNIGGEPIEEFAGFASENNQRMIILRELISKRHMQFVAFYKQQASKDDSDKKKSDKKKEKVDYSDVYMEEFSIAPSDASDDTGRISTDSSIHNVVEMYDLIQPDINNLRQTLWGNYETDDSSPDVQAYLKYEYNTLASDFEADILKGHKSNLPSIPDKQVKNFKLNNIAQSRKKPALTESKLRNVIYKSFIFLNETIVLNVKGKMYRKPGKFITIKGDLSPSAAEELWFVIEVKHKFENGIYRNEIKAVRFLADGPTSPPRGDGGDNAGDAVNEEEAGGDDAESESEIPKENVQPLTEEQKERLRKLGPRLREFGEDLYQRGEDGAEDFLDGAKKLWERFKPRKFDNDNDSNRNNYILGDNSDFSTPPVLDDNDDDRVA